MYTWILILFVHVGAMGDGNSDAITTAEFRSEQACKNAGKLAKGMATGTVKSIEWVCVPDSIPEPPLRGSTSGKVGG